MSRDDGFAVADLSTDLLDDPKVKALWRDLAEPGRMGHALTLYTATVLASWRQGQRVTVADAAPVWLALDDALVAALQEVKLLDHTGRLPLRSWKSWFGPAWDRREKRRKAGALGGRPPREAPGNHMDSTRLSLDNPDRPSGRSVRTVRQDRPNARETPSKTAGTNGRLADHVSREALAAIGAKP